MVGGRRVIDVHAGVEGEGASSRPPAKVGSVGVRVFILAVLLLLSCLGGTAQAAPEIIAGSGTGAGEVLTPRGTAVDQETGDLYVADFNFLGSDSATARIDKFDSQGNFLLGWGWGVADGVSQELQTCGPEATPPTKFCFTPDDANTAVGAGSILPEAVAVDQQSHAVYVADALNRRVTKFTASGEFVFMVGKEVDQGGGTPSNPGNICTAQDLENGDVCGAAGSGTGPNEFSDPRAIAVDSSGVVWIGDGNRIKSFSPSGVGGAEIILSGTEDIQSLALDSGGDFFVKSASLPGIRKLEAGTGALLETLDVAGEAVTVTLDEVGNVYVGDATNPYRFKKYNPAGEQALEFGAGQVIGRPSGNALAIGEGVLYVASSRAKPEAAVQAFPLPQPGPLPENQRVEDLLPTTATVTAKLNPEGQETTYHFEYDTLPYGENEAGHGTSVPVPDATLASADFDSEAVEAHLEGLVPSTTYHFRLCASNSAGTVCGPDTGFTTPSAVLIDPEWVSNLSAHNATVNAELNPLGVEAEAWLEYGTDEGYGQVVPLANLGEGLGAVPRRATLTGLLAATTYHYRFSARDTRDGNVYTVHGADRTFNTQFGGLGFQLPDGRAWEMVSPPDKHGARLVGGGEIHLQASADGESLAYQSYLSTETDPEGNRILEPSMNRARRQENGVWRSKDITPPNENVTRLALGQGTEYKLFNSDLSEALVDPRSGTPLSSEASERTPYLRNNSEPPVYTPLVTGKEPYANVPPDTEFGGGDGATGAVQVVAASPDFEHFVLRSREVPLVENAPATGETLYEWSGGQIVPISVSPAGEGAGAIVTANLVGSGPTSVDGALSRDGSRVFWSAGNPPSALYLRYNATEPASAISGGPEPECTEAERACTVRIDIKQSGSSGIGAKEPIFQGGSADGTVVFFTDSQQLTENASPHGTDLYRCELPGGSAAAGCATLTDISVPTDAGESGEVEGLAAGFTEDGTKIYFVAKGMLDEAPNQLGAHAVSGQPNLYVWHQGEGVRFIATLSNDDSTDWGRKSASDSASFAGALTAAISPSGRYLGFMSQRNLTGYDNRDESTGEAAQEVFRYDSATEQLECVSCNPSGARPHSAIPSQAYRAFVDPWKLWQGRLVAGALPEATSTTILTGGGVSLYRPRAVLDDGRVFFNAIDSLVPADSNGQWDVYQYEPTGVGDCSASSGGGSISRSAGGCASLISSGTAEEEAAFFDADETGDNAFFWTPAQLSVLDEDHEADIYDARVEGIPATRPNNSECLGEACQPPSQVPNDPTPASSAFNGAGNVKPGHKHCGKGKRRVFRKGKGHCRPHRHKRSGGTSRRARR